jgi:hypothetical protein
VQKGPQQCQQQQQQHPLCTLQAFSECCRAGAA